MKIKERGVFAMNQNYLESVVDNIKKLTSDQYVIDVQKTKKLNGVELNGVLIKNPSATMCPVLYIDDYFEEGYTPEETAIQLVEKYQKLRENEVPFDVKKLVDIDMVKDRICYKVVNAEYNEGLLTDCPHMDFTDLSIMFYVDLGDGATITIHNALADDIWKVSVDDLFDLAEDNTQRLYPYQLSTMGEVMADMMQKDGQLEMMKLQMGVMDMSDEELKAHIADEIGGGVPMMVLRSDSYYGATALFYPNLATDIREQIGSDYFVLPSSVSEVLLVPREEGMKISDLKEMVHLVNEQELSREQLLSESVYIVTKDGIFMATDEVMQTIDDRNNIDAR